MVVLAKPDNRIDPHIAAMFMHAVYYQPVRCVVERRGKIYSMWADKRSRRKIISDAQLAKLDTEQFVQWLRERSPIARMLFPDPSVYRQEVRYS